jgi:tetratricopeptide (TPR) repeat protein
MFSSATISAAADDRETRGRWPDEEAHAPSSHLIDGNPGDAASNCNRGRPIADFDQAIRLDPKSPCDDDGRGKAYSKAALASNWRGQSYFENKQHALAMIDDEQALRLDPLLSEARQNRARAQAALAMLQTAPAPRPLLWLDCLRPPLTALSFDRHRWEAVHVDTILGCVG